MRPSTASSMSALPWGVISRSSIASECCTWAAASPGVLFLIWVAAAISVLPSCDEFYSTGSSSLLLGSKRPKEFAQITHQDLRFLEGGEMPATVVDVGPTDDRIGLLCQVS